MLTIPEGYDSPVIEARGVAGKVPVIWAWVEPARAARARGRVSITSVEFEGERKRKRWSVRESLASLYQHDRSIFGSGNHSPPLTLHSELTQTQFPGIHREKYPWYVPHHCYKGRDVHAARHFLPETSRELGLSIPLVPRHLTTTQVGLKLNGNNHVV